MTAYATLFKPAAPAAVEQKKPRPARVKWRLALVILGLLACGAAALLAFAYVAGWVGADPASHAQNRSNISRPIRAGQPFNPDDFLTSDPKDLRPLSRDEAIRINGEAPLMAGGNVPARSLVIPLEDGQSYLRSVDCMTAAIYYEAATEPRDGQRAVAQVILNRVRHPAYPSTVCGVVFQGAERTTGCQFSFTCDGSLARLPSRSGWVNARAVAVAALGGQVYDPVGLATHYHADYVVPYWAGEMLKSAVIGRHIFYRFQGSWGRQPEYRMAYAGHEPDLMGRTADGQIVATLAAEADGALVAGTEAVAPTARPVLANNGTILGSTLPALTDKGEASPAIVPLVSRAAPQRTIEGGTTGQGRWVIGMKTEAPATQ